MSATAAMSRLEWRSCGPEGFKPNRRVWVMVRGPSPVSTTPLRYIVARYDPEFRPLAPWRDLDGDSIEDCGLDPAECEWTAL